MTTHTAHRTGDTICCPKCGKQWDVNDPEPPECAVVSVKRAKYLKRIDQLYGVKPK